MIAKPSPLDSPASSSDPDFKTPLGHRHQAITAIKYSYSKDLRDFFSEQNLDGVPGISYTRNPTKDADHRLRQRKRDEQLCRSVAVRLKTDTQRRNLLSQLYVSACNGGIPPSQKDAANPTSIGSEDEDYNVQQRLSPVLNRKVRFPPQVEEISPLVPSKETFHLPPLKVLQQQQPRTK